MSDTIMNFMFSDYLMVILSVVSLLVAFVSLITIMNERQRNREYTRFLNQNYNIIFDNSSNNEKALKNILKSIVGYQFVITKYKTEKDLNDDLDISYRVNSFFYKPRFVIYDKHFDHCIKLISYGKIERCNFYDNGDKKDYISKERLYLLNIEYNYETKLNFAITGKTRLSIREINLIKQVSEKYCKEVLKKYPSRKMRSYDDFDDFD